ncbi:MAG: hypothetical protein KGZ92_08565 [Firmicutes bacterium]|nr:hypothetical protein [Dethiobacter sp.]MBS3889321.1 hypothetical protein [Bacillota bacterium]MBS4055004.1 hypothetical protein [Thermaerobacter sp.]
MSRLWQHRVTIITGGYGSGKTEVAINLSLRKRQFYEADPISLVDLDIVNPYFRSRDKVELLERRGVDVVAPVGELRHADLPALPPSIGGLLSDTNKQVVLDVGGDPAGATVLGRYRDILSETPYDMFLVVNPHRPTTSTVPAVLELMQALEHKARLKITAFCNNTNLMGLTVPEDVVRGQDFLHELEVRTGLSTAFVSCKAEIAPRVSSLLPNHTILPLELHMLPPWVSGG